jgi:hypothetical protein
MRGAKGQGVPLGLMRGMGYEEDEIMLGVGDAALFYSDGLVEAHDPEGEMFGFPRLRALVAEHGEEQALAVALERRFTSLDGRSVRGYDVTYQIPPNRLLQHLVRGGMDYLDAAG